MSVLGNKLGEKILRVGSAAWANRDFAAKLVSVTTTLDAHTRQSRLAELNASLWEKLSQSKKMGQLADAKGSVNKLLVEEPWIRTQLKRQPHFGALQQLVAPAKPTRAEYVGMQLTMLLELKDAHKGLGLGSKVTGLPENAPFGKGFTNLELVQMWAVLLSVGRLFGTHSTERAMAYRLAKEPKLIRHLVTQIDEPAKIFTERILRNSAQPDLLPIVVAAWAVSRKIKDRNMKQQCLWSLQLYADRSPSVAKALNIHRIVRRAAYINIQGRCAMSGLHKHLQPSLSGFLLQSDPAGYFDKNVIAYDHSWAEQTELAQLLNAIDNFQEKQFFASVTAQKLVLQHVREFKEWWTKRSEVESFDASLESLFQKPGDWPCRPVSGNHLMRLQVPKSESWFQAIQQWLGPSDGGCWTNTKFILTAGTETTIDLFCDPGTEIQPETVNHIAQTLVVSDGNNATGKDAHLFERAVAGFGAMLLAQVLKPGLRLLLTPIATGNREMERWAALTFLQSDKQRLLKKVSELALTLPANESRKVELEQLADLADADDRSDACVYVFFAARLELIEGERIVAEIDLALAKILPNEVVWYFAEAKQGRQSGTSQMKALTELFRCTTSPIESYSHSGRKIVWTSLKWPVA